MTVWEGVGLTVFILVMYIWAPVGGLKSLIDSIKEQEKREQEEREKSQDPTKGK